MTVLSDILFFLVSFPNPVQQSRLPGRLFHAADWYEHQGRFQFSQNFRLEIEETFRAKWKDFFRLGEGPRFKFQTCNIIER